MNERIGVAGLSRRQMLVRGARLTAGVGALGSLGTLLEACGQGGGQSTTGAPAATAAPGLDIPAARVDFSMSPFADDTIPVIAMKLGYFKDNGITIGPTPTGAKLNLTENVAPLVSGQVQAGSAVFEVLLSKLDNITNIRTFLVHGSFEGYALFVPDGSKAKSVEELVAAGVPFDQAVGQAITQFKGKRIAFSTDPSAQLFYQLLFAQSGRPESDYNVTRLANANIVSLILAGRTDLAAPSGGPQVVQLANAGLRQVLNEQQILQASKDQRRLGLINHSSFVVRSDFYGSHYETVLRMAAAIFRALDLLRRNPAGAAAAQLPFLNSYAGSAVTANQLAFLDGTITHERTFDEMGAFFTQPNAFNIYTSGTAQLAALRKQNVLRAAHSVDELDGAKRVWEDLTSYRVKADALFKAKSGGDAKVIAAARRHYEGRNYLDAYRALATLQ